MAKEGIPFILSGVALVIACLAVPGWMGAGLFIVYTLFALWFFRDPDRITPSGDNLVICPADGQVVEVLQLDNVPYMVGPVTKVGIFMSPFSVHVNRAPVSGEVELVVYKQGLYVNASYERASLVNEHNAVILKREDGVRVMFVQVAGFVARRIVCYLAKGDRLTAGERIGLIRFGSRVDVYMPQDAEILVQIGDAATAGETVLGKI